MKHKNIIIGFFTDVITSVIIAGFVLGYAKLLEAKAMMISGGRTVEQLKIAMLTNTVEGNEAILANVQQFALLITVGTLIVLACLLIFFSGSRLWLWKTLLGKRFSLKDIWKWVGMTAILAVIFIGLSLASLIVLFILSAPFAFISATIHTILLKLVKYSFLLLFFFVMFLAYHNLVRSNQVWESMGKVFHSLKSRKMWKGFLIALGVLVGLNVISYFLQKQFIYQQQFFMYLGLVIFVIYIGWVRSLVYD
jgi:hypothetical protein